MTTEDLNKLKIDKRQSGSMRGSRRRNIVRLAIVAAVLFLLGYLLVSGGLAPKVEVMTATVSQMYPSQSFTELNASGYVVAQRKAALAAKTTGRLVWLGVEEGNRVRAGQILARLESEDAAATRDQAAANVDNALAGVEQLKAELADATLAYNRQKELVAQGIVARADYDAAEARYLKAKAALAATQYQVNSSRAALRNAQVNLDYALIRAPFDGVVLTKSADVGDIVTPVSAAANAKAAVVTIADMGSLQVEADVSESNLAKVKPGQPCEIQLDALPDTRFRGAVHMIVPTADRSKATVLVKVRFVDRDLRILPEMSAKVAFLQREAKPEERLPRVAVTSAAVVTRNGKKVVYVVKGETVVETPVSTGASLGDLLEVTAGVKAGDKVAIKPLDKLKNGTKITTAEK